MKKIYCISGLGADERVFTKIKIPGCQLQHLQWLVPNNEEPIEQYASRMAEQIEDDNPILMGLSFGGMMCIEIAKLKTAEKIILISSISTFKELPLWMKIAGKLRLNRIIPLPAYNPVLQPIQNYHIGATTKEEKEIVRNYRKNVSQVYLNWAINAVLNWKNNVQPASLFHIHGDADKIFPIRNVKPDCIVKGGTHLMVFSQAREVNEFVARLIRQ